MSSELTSREKHESQEYPDVALLQHVNELLAQITALDLPPRVNDEGEDDWTDNSDVEVDATEDVDMG